MTYKYFLFFLITLATYACKDGGSVYVNPATLPKLSTFLTKPSEQFLVDPDDVTRTSPFVGKNNPDPHNGAHVHFQNNGAIPEHSPIEAYPAIYAIADGTISEVNTFEAVGKNYKYYIFLAFAQDNGELVSFEYGIEPLFKPTSSTFYEPFVLVNPGDKVKAGDIIARMYLPVSSGFTDNGSHIHFSIQNDSTKQAPVIFDSAIKTEFINKLTDGGECMGIDLTAAENPQADVATDCL